MPLLCPSRSQNSQRRDPCPCLSPAPRGWAGRSLAACSHGRRGGNKNIRSSPRVCGRGMKGPLQGRSRPVPGREVFIFPLRGSSVRGRVGGGKGKLRDGELVLTAVTSLCHLPASYVGKKAPRSCPPPWTTLGLGLGARTCCRDRSCPAPPGEGRAAGAGMRVGKAGDWSCQRGKKALLMPPSPQPGQGKDPSPRGSSTEPTGACLAQVVPPAPGSVTAHCPIPSRWGLLPCPHPSSSLEPAGFELPTHIKGHKFGLGLHKFDSINISFRRV